VVVFLPQTILTPIFANRILYHFSVQSSVKTSLPVWPCT